MLSEAFFLRERHWAKRYGLALLLTFASFVVTSVLEAHHFSHLFFFNFTSIISISLYGGFGPAILSSILGAFGIDYLYVHPVNSIELQNPENIIRGLSFLVTALVTSWLVTQLKSSLKRMSIALHEAEKLQQRKNEFIAVVSHDLGSALTGISMSSKTLVQLTDTDKLSPLLKEFARAIYETSSQAADTIRELFDASKMEAGIFQIRPSLCSIQDLLEEQIRGFRSQNPLRSIEFRSEINGGKRLLELDAAKMRRAISNLLSNAVKYSPADKPVEIGLQREETRFRIWVKDEGRGISERDLQHLFEKYRRLDGGKEEGSGLGLFITKGIIEAHGGKIEVQSTKYKGTTFTITLPSKPQFEKLSF